MGETGKSFRESWSQRLTDADTVTESDVISLYQDLRSEIAARASGKYLAAREDGDKRLVLDHATSDVAANLMVAAKEAAEDYEREIARRQELSRWVETHQRAEIAFAAQQAGLDARRDTLREGLLFRIPALYGGPSQ